jgi:cyclopropane fatty-acyl-phospholipid synthase-like methyltransferase
LQVYNEQTAAMYNDIWGGYGRAFGTAVVSYLNKLGATPGFAIDLACGTGDLVEVLCQQGYSTLGIDCSPAMVSHAQQRCLTFQHEAIAEFQLADIGAFETGGRSASLVTSSYDSINHLQTEDEWSSCFKAVSAALSSDGHFIFDINTLRGLEDWNRIRITERPRFTVISRGFFEPSTGKAWKKFSGFRQVEMGLFERFEQIISNTALKIRRVVELLTLAHLAIQHIALLSDLSTPIEDAEMHDRVVLVARRAST